MQSLTRRLVIRLLTFAGLILASIVGFYFAITQRFDEGELGVLAVLSGLITGVALAIGRNGVEVLLRRRMLGGAWGRIRPGGARVVALTGRLEARDTPLGLPFVDAPFLAAAYDVRETPPTKYDQRFENQSGPRRTLVHMGGMLSTDSVLKLEVGDVPLLGVLLAENFPLVKTPVTALAEPILAHSASPGVNERAFGSATDAAMLLDLLGEMRHGHFQHEWASRASLADVVERAQVDATHCDLEVRSISAGAEVSVIGLYDQAAGGLLANPDSGLIELFPGDAREARSDMLASAGRKLGMSLFLIIFALLVAFGTPILMQTSDEDRLARLHNIESITVTELSDALARGLVTNTDELDALYDRLLVGTVAAGAHERRALLIQYGADPDRMRPDGTLPFIRAAMRGGGDLFGYLLKDGADPNVRGGPGALTPLEWVADLGQFFAAKHLLQLAPQARGEIPDPSALSWLPDTHAEPVAALAAAYAADAVNPPWPDDTGAPLYFAGGVSDGRTASIRFTDGRETRVHTLRLGMDGWQILRVTRLEEPLRDFDLP